MTQRRPQQRLRLGRKGSDPPPAVHRRAQRACVHMRGHSARGGAEHALEQPHLPPLRRPRAQRAAHTREQQPAYDPSHLRARLSASARVGAVHVNPLGPRARLGAPTQQVECSPRHRERVAQRARAGAPMEKGVCEGGLEECAQRALDLAHGRRMGPQRVPSGRQVLQQHVTQRALHRETARRMRVREPQPASHLVPAERVGARAEECEGRMPERRRLEP